MIDPKHVKHIKQTESALNKIPIVRATGYKLKLDTTSQQFSSSLYLPLTQNLVMINSFCFTLIHKSDPRFKVKPRYKKALWQYLLAGKMTVSLKDTSSFYNCICSELNSFHTSPSVRRLASKFRGKDKKFRVFEDKKGFILYHPNYEDLEGIPLPKTNIQIKDKVINLNNHIEVMRLYRQNYESRLA